MFIHILQAWNLIASKLENLLGWWTKGFVFFKPLRLQWQMAMGIRQDPTTLNIHPIEMYLSTWFSEMIQKPFEKKDLENLQPDLAFFSPPLPLEYLSTPDLSVTPLFPSPIPGARKATQPTGYFHGKWRPRDSTGHVRAKCLNLLSMLDMFTQQKNTLCYSQVLRIGRSLIKSNSYSLVWPSSPVQKTNYHLGVTVIIEAYPFLKAMYPLVN